MSNNEASKRLPDNTHLKVVAQRVDFIAGIRKGLNQIERGATIAHEEVKRQLSGWFKQIE